METCPVCYGEGEIKSYGAFGETEYKMYHNCNGRGFI